MSTVRAGRSNTSSSGTKTFSHTISLLAEHQILIVSQLFWIVTPGVLVGTMKSQTSETLSGSS